MRHAWIPAVLLLAGFLLTKTGSVGYGTALFVLFPLAAGYSLAAFGLTRRLSVLITGAFIALGGILMVGAEGLICVLMAIPIVLPLLLLGYWLQRYTQGPRTPPDDGPLDRPLALALPLLLLLTGSTVEYFFAREPAWATVTTRATLAYPAAEVFDHLKQMDTLDAPQPLLLVLGLPHPNKCVLEGDSVGARRTCLFEEGSIESRVARFEPGRALELDVTDYRLPAGAWLAFNHAAYQLEARDGQTLVTRTTTYRSFLRPRFYWQAVERWTIGQEHQFVLASLARNLAK